ncbi:MAG TPA: VOC family protein [Planctomycetota bacterium]|nr:VOC family protein [Planctomycetota bacterium]
MTNWNGFILLVALVSGMTGAALVRGQQAEGGPTVIKGLSVAYIHSAYGDKLSEWYTKTLGLKVDATFPGWTEFKMGTGSRFAIDSTSFPQSVVEKQPIVLSFAVEDIKKAVKDFADRGVKFYPSAERTIFDVGPSFVATFEDPDGNWVQLNQPKK